VQKTFRDGVNMMIKITWDTAAFICRYHDWTSVEINKQPMDCDSQLELAGYLHKMISINAVN